MQWLGRQAISYTEKVVDQSDRAMSDFMRINDGMVCTPFTIIDNAGETTKIAGFDMAKFKIALGVG